jgi:DNA invertase Pin-like site-specific DNA recombinase
MKVIYARVSTTEQNESRQLTSGLKTFIDRCSGAIPFLDRPQGKKLISFLKLNPQAITLVKSVDRLGRNTIDILNIVQMFKDNEWNIEIEDLGMNSKSPFFDLMISLMGTLAEHERKMIKERTRQGIEIRKAKGGYKGRVKGSKDDRDKILAKHLDIVNCLNEGMSIAKVLKTIPKSKGTIYKVKNLL